MQKICTSGMIYSRAFSGSRAPARPWGRGWATQRYKMRAVGSRPSTRPKHWQPVNSSQFIIKLYYRPTSSSEKNAFFLNKCLDLYGSNIICARSILGWIVQIETFEGKLLLSIFVLLLTVVATVGLNDRFGRSLLLIFL